MQDFKRLFAPPKDSFFLFGPRGTGKTTWVKENYPDSIYIDLLMPGVARLYVGNPDRLVNVLDGHRGNEVVIVDEVQKVPELLSVVHAIIEQKRGFKFILTGSSVRKLKRTGVDLLAGRAVKKAMHPFMAKEIGDAFELEKALKIGMLPLVWGADEKKSVLESYVDLYVMEEVQLEGLVRNLSSFSRFLSAIAFSHANVLNLSNVARECEVTRPTVENYVVILQDLLLASLIPVFTRRAKRMLVAHPKFYFFDCGVFCTLRKLGPLDSTQEINGGALEGLVFQHLSAWCDYTKGRYDISYWRTKSGLEVDFIIYGDEGFWAIEVKNGTKVSSADVRGLTHFVQDYPECKPILLYRGKEQIMEKGILCMPCERFLKELVPDQPLFNHL